MSFPVRVWSGLIESKHRRAMSTAGLWLYLWLVVRVTSEKDGTGIVLGHKPIKLKEIAEDLGWSLIVIKRLVKRLTKETYLKTIRTPYGLVFYINKSKKFKWGGYQKCPPKVSKEIPPIKILKDIKDIKLDITHFDSLWEKYPKKIGKQKALVHFQATVKTEKDLIDVKTALENYIKSRRVYDGFPMDGSRWFNKDWQDWVVMPESEVLCPKCKNTGKYVSSRGYDIMCPCKEEHGR